MLDRREIIAGSAALGASLMLTAQSVAQTVVVPETKRGFIKRPNCEIYYEVTGVGPPLVFLHGGGSNHLTWWQQVPHFMDRYTCITFAHRGFAPSSYIGVPDPREYGGDWEALIDQLQLPSVSLIAQSMGGIGCIEYILANTNHRVKALVLASNCGTIDKASVPTAHPERLAEWQRKSSPAAQDKTRRGSQHLRETAWRLKSRLCTFFTEQ